MANPQKENGYTPIANELLDRIVSFGFSKREYEIILLILRYTYGFKKLSTELSLNFIAGKTTIHKPDISKTLKYLYERKIIFYNGTEIGLQKDYEKWQSVSKTLTPSVSKTLTNREQNTNPSLVKHSQSVSKTLTPIYVVKENIKKTIKENIKPPFAIFEEILATTVFKPIAERFLEYRKEIKKPFKSPKSLTAWLSQLERLSGGNYETAAAIVEQSIANQWQGIFELKSGQGIQSKKAKGQYETGYKFKD